jgi:hypothetical protein
MKECTTDLSIERGKKETAKDHPAGSVDRRYLRERSLQQHVPGKWDTNSGGEEKLDFLVLSWSDRRIRNKPREGG